MRRPPRRRAADRRSCLGAQGAQKRRTTCVAARAAHGGPACRPTASRARRSRRGRRRRRRGARRARWAESYRRSAARCAARGAPEPRAAPRRWRPRSAAGAACGRRPRCPRPADRRAARRAPGHPPGAADPRDRAHAARAWPSRRSGWSSCSPGRRSSPRVGDRGRAGRHRGTTSGACASRQASVHERCQVGASGFLGENAGRCRTSARSGSPTIQPGRPGHEPVRLSGWHLSRVSGSAIGT